MKSRHRSDHWNANHQHEHDCNLIQSNENYLLFSELIWVVFSFMNEKKTFKTLSQLTRNFAILWVVILCDLLRSDLVNMWAIKCWTTSDPTSVCPIRSQKQNRYCTYSYCAMTIYFFTAHVFVIAFIYQAFTVSIHFVLYSDNRNPTACVVVTRNGICWLEFCTTYKVGSECVRDSPFDWYASIVFIFNLACAMRSFFNLSVGRI